MSDKNDNKKNEEPKNNSDVLENEEVQSIQSELEESQKNYLYLRAEFDNYRKQSTKERSDLIRFGGEALARDLLSVLDIFEKALSMNVNSENIQSFIDGVKLTEKELKGVFSKHGIQELESKGKLFDPETSEALSQIPTSDCPDGHVYDVMRKGYLYHDRVLRYAQVVVANNPDSQES